ncbi:protein mono-ADP-ribosyltransferase PARP12-like isoform X1 [Alosa alosa]|uniref:protein mono-ADP-ribosyltransferase PARP12-like isoform X1 n=1 Tax=Alosa alosa TaxID=278164 RepID=UPI00201530A4|nr:protein mono-ADP-ribosyltransferase PARP12-like isoform X1 [Alosa alosa]
MSEAGLLKIICGNGGAIDYDRLLELASGFPDINCSEFDLLLGNKQFFHLTENDGVKQILAKTNMKICSVPMCHKVSSSCTNLHLCKLYLHGECKARRCCYGHNLNSAHNANVLSNHRLQKLSRAEIRQLLLQNDSPHSLLPPVCIRYNQGDGDFGKCDDQDNCTYLHICEDYIRGTCDSAGDCGRSHDFFEPHPMTTLRRRGVPDDKVGSMLSVYQRILVLRGTLAKDLKPNPGARTRGRRGKAGKGHATATTNTEATKDVRSRARPEINEICLFFVRADCKQDNRCWRVHSKMPYQWQVKMGESWTDLPNSEDIERDFCNPINTTALREGDPVRFDTMTCGPHKVRRLSTASSVAQPDFILTTKWIWFWEDEYGKWIPYGSIKEMHRLSSISSSDLEKRYQDDNKAVVLFTAATEQYEVSFKVMEQKNMSSGKTRQVRRRPKFVSSYGVQTARTSDGRGSPPPLTSNPGLLGNCPLMQRTRLIGVRVTLLSTDRDYLKVQELFRKTLSGFDIVSVERIQNKKLWEDFQTKRDRMKKANQDKKYADGERLLFHGTNSQYIDAICFQNFDCSKCGANGTVYGEGCYFARDASYSNNYTSGHGKRSMFVCRVLVGCYTRGQSQYPPSRDGGLILYDSCVNDVRDPSIFVVFDKQQVYPEFLITYTEHVYRPPVTLDSSSDSDSDFTLLSPVKTTVTSTESFYNSSHYGSTVLTSITSAPQLVTIVSTLASHSSVSPSPASLTTGQKVHSSSGTVSVQLSSSDALAPTVGASSPFSVSTTPTKPSTGSPQSSATTPVTHYSPFRSSHLDPAQASAVSTTPSAPVPSAARSVSTTPSAPVPSASRSVSTTPSAPVPSGSRSLSTSSKQPSNPLQAAQTSKRDFFSDDGGWEYVDSSNISRSKSASTGLFDLQTSSSSTLTSHQSGPRPASRRSLYSSPDASLVSSSVRSAATTPSAPVRSAAAATSASARRVSPSYLSTSTSSYTRQVPRPQSQDIYYVPTPRRQSNEPKKKEECILL